MLRSKLLLACMALIFAAGCESRAFNPTPTSQPLPTEMLQPTVTVDWFPRTPTPTLFVPEATATPVPTLINPGYTQVLIEDGFADITNWSTGQSKQGNITLEDKALVLAIPGPKSELSSLSTYRLPGDFFLETTVDVSLCSTDDAYGVIFWRFSEMGTYTFLLNCQGQFRIERQINASFAVLVDWTVSSRIQPGSPSRHTISIWAKDGVVHFYVDGTSQYELQSRKQLQGGLGLIARSASDLPETIIFSNLRVTKP